MPRHNTSFFSELATEWRSVHRSQVKYADLVRRLEYPAVLARIRSPPVPLLLVLAGLLNALLILAVRLPLHALARLAALLPDPPLNPKPGSLRRDLRSLLSAATDTARYAVHWLHIVGLCLWIELKILAHIVAINLFLAALYVALFMGLSWLLFFILGA